jgi:hypothetical protein
MLRSSEKNVKNLVDAMRSHESSRIGIILSRGGGVVSCVRRYAPVCLQVTEQIRVRRPGLRCYSTVKSRARPARPSTMQPRIKESGRSRVCTGSKRRGFLILGDHEKKRLVWFGY